MVGSRFAYLTFVKVLIKRLLSFILVDSAYAIVFLN